MKSLLCCALFLSVAAIAADAATSDPVVSVTGGQVRGRVIAQGDVAAFKGIPFAAPPLGDLRWREPQPVKAWQGVREADSFGASCVQEIHDWNRQEATGNKEDCLYLNVWSPGWSNKAKKPVMLWLHGGGNTGGGASVDYFDGASLARKGVVVVTINYRLGLFGFFAHPELAAESAHHAAGDYGLLDQMAALKWVHDNIARFGGDPGNVTVFGQSAGSADTSFVVASPLTKGLFHKAIQESGSPARDMLSLQAAGAKGVNFAASLKAPATGQIKYLRSLPADQLQKAAVAAPDSSAPNMGPSVDGWYMPIPASRAFAEGKENAVPLLIGSNAQEMGGPKPEAVRQTIATYFGASADKAIAFYGLKDGGAGNADPLFGPVTRQVEADGRQRCGSVQQAIWHAAAKNPVYEYQFDRPVAGRPATQHSAELPYLFGNLLPGGFLGGPFNEADRKVSNDVQTYWTNFAKTGDPNGAGMPAWTKFESGARPYLEFTNDTGPVMKAGLRREICDLYMANLKQELARAGD